MVTAGQRACHLGVTGKISEVKWLISMFVGAGFPGIKFQPNSDELLILNLVKIQIALVSAAAWYSSDTAENLLVLSLRRLNNLAIVTPFSRDDRGYTPLHAAAACGELLDQQEPLKPPARLLSNSCCCFRPSQAH